MTLCLIILTIIIIYILFNPNGLFPLWTNKRIELFRAYYEIPRERDYTEAMEKFNHLIPFQELDFENPFHRWMYYYYPNYYAKYYKQLFPFEGDFHGWNLEYVRN